MAFKLKNIAKFAALATAGFCGVSSSYQTNNFNSNHADLKSLFSARKVRDKLSKGGKYFLMPSKNLGASLDDTKIC